MFNHSSNIEIHGGTFTAIDQVHQHHHEHHHGSLSMIQNAGERGIDRLIEASSPGAFHNSGDRYDSPKCHPNTHTAVLRELMDWCVTKMGTEKFIIWLYGPASAGKSAIAQSFAEQCNSAAILLATFFFSRTDPKRNHAHALVATIAYQVASRIPGAKSIIESTVEADPLIFKRSFETQFKVLIVDPLSRLPTPRFFMKSNQYPYLIIIDGLDECLGRETQRDILKAILSTAGSLRRHPLRILIASRSEYHIATLFTSPPFSNQTRLLALDDHYKPYNDIKLYLKESFHEIRQTHILRAQFPDPWPKADVISKLVERSSGQFIYAATVIRYVSSPRHNPLERLNIILGLLPVSNTSDSPFAELDALYTSILASVEDIDTTLQFLGILLFTNKVPRLKPFDIEVMMSLREGALQLLLMDLASVMTSVHDEPPLRFLHASFGDFLLDSTRSHSYYLEPTRIHREMACLCIRRVDMFYNSGFSISHSDTVLFYAFHNLVHHLKMSIHADSNELFREVCNVPYIQCLPKLYKFCLNYYEGYKIRGGAEYAEKFLQSLKSSSPSDIEKLYIPHRRIFDTMIRSGLEKFPDDRGRAFFMAYLTASPDIFYLSPATIFALSPSLEDPAYFSSTAYILHFDDYGTTVPTESQSSILWMEGDVSGYWNFLRAYMSDASRAGSFFVDGYTYTMAAEYLISFALRPWDGAKARIPEPFQWTLIWDMFPCIFSKAERSDALIQLLSRNNLTLVLGRPYSNVRPKLRSLFNALGNYLIMCRSSLPNEFGVGVDWTKWSPSPYEYYPEDEFDSTIGDVYHVTSST